MLHKALQHAKNKYTLLASVWKVYSILLEYCCRSNYDMLIKEISTEHQNAMEAAEAKFNEEIRTMTLNETALKLSVDDMQKENGEYKKRLDEEIQLRIKL